MSSILKQERLGPEEPCEMAGFSGDYYAEPYGDQVKDDPSVTSLSGGQLDSDPANNSQREVDGSGVRSSSGETNSHNNSTSSSSSCYEDRYAVYPDYGLVNQSNSSSQQVYPNITSLLDSSSYSSSYAGPDGSYPYRRISIPFPSSTKDCLQNSGFAEQKFVPGFLDSRLYNSQNAKTSGMPYNISYGKAEDIEDLQRSFYSYSSGNKLENSMNSFQTGGYSMLKDSSGFDSFSRTPVNFDPNLLCKDETQGGGMKPYHFINNNYLPDSSYFHNYMTNTAVTSSSALPSTDAAKSTHG